MPTKRYGLRVVAFAAGIALFVFLYQYAAGAGVLGSVEQAKLHQQTGDLGILFGGRGEAVAALSAISDAPILGHGSWAKDATGRYSLEMRYWFAALGYGAPPLTEAAELIPTHSHVLGAWVEAGALGGLFWLWTISIVLRGAVGQQVPARLMPLLAFACSLLLWDILFSPYGAERRLLTPFLVLVALSGCAKGGTTQQLSRGWRMKSYPQASFEPANRSRDRQHVEKAVHETSSTRHDRNAVV